MCVLPDARMEAANEKKKRDPALSQAFTGQASSQSKSRRRMLWGYMQEKGWWSRARMRPCRRDGTAKRKRCAYERDALSCFFCVRSVISTPVCGENAHHVVLPAGSLVSDSPTEIHI